MIEIQRKIFITATLLGLVGVVLGAFAAHGLRSVLTDSALESFQTGVRYQMYHAFFLFVIGLNSHLSSAQKKYILGLTLAGIILFSLSFTHIPVISKPNYNALFQRTRLLSNYI